MSTFSHGVLPCARANFGRQKLSSSSSCHTDEAEADEPELDLPAEIERREARLAAIREARERLEQRQREADLERGRSDDDDRRPRGPDGKPKGGRYKREFGVPED